MSTSNFLNDKNGIFVLPGSTDYDYTDDDFNCGMVDLVEELKDDLSKIGWSIEESLDIFTYPIYDKQGRTSGELEFVSGYYSGAQVIYSSGRDIYKELREEGNDSIKRSDYNFHDKYVIKILKKNTYCLSCVAVLGNGEAIYEQVKD